jgi:hypothetical protein
MHCVKCGKEVIKAFEIFDKVHRRTASVRKKGIRLGNEFNQLGLKWVLTGGIAVDYYGYERSTKDIDFLMSQEDYNKLVENRHRIEGLKTRPNTKNMYYFGEETDFIFPGDRIGGEKPAPPLDLVADRNGIISLVGLLYIKMFRMRSQDKTDAIELIKRHPELSSDDFIYLGRDVADRFEQFKQQADEEFRVIGR